MINRVEVAKRFIEAQRQVHPEIVGALLTGSVARGEDNESSDIDLSVLMAGDISLETRGNLATWQDGIFMDVAVRSQQLYSDLETVLSNVYHTTHMNDALILYDPTGVFTQVQQAVREVYMQPHILRRRLQIWLDWLRTFTAKLPEAIANDDPLTLCSCPGVLVYSTYSLVLLNAGITPSSTRGLLQLGAVDPAIKAQLITFFGADKLDATKLLDLVPLSEEFADLVENEGELPHYFVKKATWLAHNGFHQEALHPLSIPVWMTALESQKNVSKVEPATPLARLWLAGVGWQGDEVLTAKVQIAQALLRQAEAIVAAV